MEIPFLIKDESGNPVTNLVKADVVLKMASSPYTEMSYTDLGTIGAADGEYVLWGVNFYPTTCRLWIKGVVQDNWFGAQEVGEFSLKYALTGDITSLNSSTVKLAGGNNISGNNAFVISAPVSYIAPTVSDHLTRKDYVDAGDATAVHNTGNESISGIKSFITNAPVSYIAPTVSDHLTRKDYVDTAITNSAFSLTANHTWTGINWFNNKIKVNGGYTSGTKNEIYGWTYFMDICPSLIGGLTPTSYQHLVNKGYVDSLVASFNGYQESQNVIRLIPSGAEITAQVYTTWGTALTYASILATVAHQYTILISGEGTASASIIPDLVSGKYLKDYVHFKGLGADVTITFGGASGAELTATDYSRVTFENLIIIINDSENPTNFAGITFKNCKFVILDSDGVTFLNCNFEGANSFYGYDNKYVFNNCIGERIFANVKISVIGTNKIQYYSPTELTIGTVSLTSVAGSLQSDNAILFGSHIESVTGNLHTTTGHIYTNYGDISTAGGSVNVGTVSMEDVGSLGRLKIIGGVDISSSLTATTINLGSDISVKRHISGGGNLSASGNLTFDTITNVAPTPTSVESFSQQFGANTGAGTVMSAPDRWGTVRIDGVNYSFPLYIQS